MNELEYRRTILAGNSRVFVDPKGNITTNIEILAFEAALRKAQELKVSTGAVPLIAVAFDHVGEFRKQFLVDGLSVREKRNPVLSQLLPEIAKEFEPIAQKYGIAMSEILAIHEDSARSSLAHRIRRRELPADVAWVCRLTTCESDDDECGSADICGTGKEEHTFSITCTAITAEYYRKAAVPPQLKHLTPLPNILLDVFFEDAPWSRNEIFVKAVPVAQSMGVNAAIRLNIVNQQLRVGTGATSFPA